MKQILLLFWLVCLSYAPAFAQSSSDTTESWTSPYALRFKSFETSVVNGELALPFSITAQEEVSGEDWRAVSDNKGFFSFNAGAVNRPVALAAGATQTNNFEVVG